jgi:YD repeat-containing protein
MIKKLVLILCVLAVTTLASTQNAHAQSAICTATIVGGMTSLFGDGTNALVPGAYNCLPFGTWFVLCLVKTALCAPASAALESCGPCNSSGSGGGSGSGSPHQKAEAGRPISLVTGNTYIEQSDIRVPGLSGGLNLTRTWNSVWPSSQITSSQGIFGPNWRSNFEERVFVGADHYVRYARGDGSYWSFGSSNGQWVLVAPANVNATMIDIHGYLTLSFQNGEQRLFDEKSGSLVAIVDRNGNTTNLSYDALGRLITVTDPSSRHLYFNYTNPAFTLLVTSVTSDVGLSLSYSYDIAGRLTQVTNPDSSIYTFSYDSQSRILSVTDSNGKILESHTYDSGSRGLTSSRAGGVEAVTVSY